MLLIYAAMALTCAYQTFFVLTAASRYRAMTVEYVEHALILAYLFFARPMRTRFSQAPHAEARSTRHARPDIDAEQQAREALNEVPQWGRSRT